jgi:hypothetical protein
VDDASEEELAECLSCISAELEVNCRPLSAISEDCPCDFDTYDYGVAAAPCIEPLVCDGEDYYPFCNGGADLREECESGIELSCR